MIGYLKGTCILASSQSCIILTQGGVGYQVYIPNHTVASIPQDGTEVTLYISTVVREDAIELYGFETLEERQTFEILKAISRIGSKTALAILSSYRPEELHDIVLSENPSALAKIPGIGAKTAQHLLLELRYKLRNAPRSSTSLPPLSQMHRDTLAALAGLGYSEAECASIVKNIFKSEPDLDTATAIRMTLKELAKGNS